MKPLARYGGLLLILVLLVLGPALAARQTPSQRAASPLPDLIGALKATPGCLGVETAQTSSGKQVIFAWFENKKVVLAWYYSGTHQTVMRQFAGDQRRPQGPLADVSDDGRPVLAIASITLAGSPGAPPSDIRSATSQIAIELYTPLPGGLAAGGRFAPASLKVPGLIDVPIAPK
jgi:hypothetical protein